MIFIVCVCVCGSGSVLYADADAGEVALFCAAEKPYRLAAHLMRAVSDEEDHTSIGTTIAIASWPLSSSSS